jgi:cytochrome o ubiquinol oxidase operon protein cyoD
MSRQDEEPDNAEDAAPGEAHKGESGYGAIQVYLLGLLLATGLTVASFWIAGSNIIWAPAIPAALIALAVAQIGVHLVFFLHITSGPENANNSLALAFGVMIVVLVVGGSIWIMGHLNHNMMPMTQMLQMQH